MGSGAEAAGLPPELPIMASLVTSGLSNLRGGDSDAVGFFQMRLSVWNTGPYAGFRKRPALQLKWFLDTASQVRERRLVHGERDPAADPKRYGRWAADVIQPAQEYRGRFQFRLGEARTLLGRSGREPFRPAPGRSAAKRAAGAMQSDQATAAPPTCPGCYRGIGARALRAALSVRGRPYTWGGNRPGTGFDASGLVQWAYGRAGARLPRIIDDQFQFGRAAKRSSLRPGDIVFFRDPAGYVSHVGLYAGDERFVHAPHTGDVVRVSSLRVPYYAQQYAGARHLG
jgi:cell wall-associated NlpC family hydrolase